MTATMPASTQRAHSDPAWKGDRLAALDDVAKLKPGKDGIRAADRNFQWFWKSLKDQALGGNAFCMHWANPGQNNYHFYLEPGAARARRMTKAELKRTKWTVAQVHRWRRTANPHSERPPTYAQMVRKAVKVGVTITAELKSNAFALDGPAAQVVRSAKRAGHPPYFMALYGSMPKCRQKCKAVIGAGGQFAVIFGSYRKIEWPFFKVAVKLWKPKPTRVW